MARVINAQRSTFIGTPSDIERGLRSLFGRGAAAVDLRYSNFVFLSKAPTERQIKQALETTPK